MEVDLIGLVKGKSGNEAGGLADKQWQGLFVKSVDQETRQITAVASTGNMDRDGDIILPSAFTKCLPEYLRNPVILAGHQHKLASGRSPVVGKTIKAWIDKQGLHVIIEFAKTDLAQEYWELYRDKFQRALSVGFKATKWEQELIDGKMVPVCREVDELYEISCVAVPANRESLSRSAKRKAVFVAQKRAAVFSNEEIAEFSVIEADGAELVELYMAADDVDYSVDDQASRHKKLRTLARDMFDVMGGDVATRMINACKGDDNESNTGVTLVDLVAGKR